MDWIIYAGAFLSTYQQIMLVVAVNGINIIIDKSCIVANFIAEYPEAIAVIAIQSVISSKPHKSMVILVNTSDSIVGQAIFYSKIFNRVVIEAITSFDNKEKKRKQPLHNHGN